MLRKHQCRGLSESELEEAKNGGTTSSIFVLYCLVEIAKGIGQKKLDQVSSNYPVQMFAVEVVQAGQCSLASPTVTGNVLRWQKDITGFEKTKVAGINKGLECPARYGCY